MNVVAGSPRPRSDGPGRWVAVALGLMLLFAPAQPLRAQTPFTAIGSGYPTQAVDARASALGSATVALLGGSYSLPNNA